MSRAYLNEQELRKRQIDTLKVFNDNVTEIKANEEYHIGFISGGRSIGISVRLCPEFPTKNPQLVVCPLLIHPWLHSPTGEILSAPGLLNFTIHSDLGRVVQAIIREFEKFPPPFWGDNSADQPCNYTSSTVMIESSIPEIANFSIDELSLLRNNPEYLDDFLENTDTLKSYNKDLDDLICEVEEMAHENMSKEEELKAASEKVSLAQSEFKTLGMQYKAANLKYAAKSDEFAPQNIKELLQIAGSTADSECEKYVEEFLGGSTDVQNFLTKYMEMKKLSAMRKAKEERLSHQLRALERGV